MSPTKIESSHDVMLITMQQHSEPFQATETSSVASMVMTVIPEHVVKPFQKRMTLYEGV